MKSAGLWPRYERFFCRPLRFTIIVSFWQIFFVDLVIKEVLRNAANALCLSKLSCNQKRSKEKVLAQNCPN